MMRCGSRAGSWSCGATSSRGDEGPELCVDETRERRDGMRASGARSSSGGWSEVVDSVVLARERTVRRRSTAEVLRRVSMMSCASWMKVKVQKATR